MVIIAALNEEAGIGLTLSELKGLLVDPFFLVVDGNSSDGTVEAARAYKAEIVMQNGEKGKGSALSQGLDYVRELDPEPDYIVLTDADYTYPAEYVPGMIEILHKDATVGMVIGNRFDKAFHYRSAIANSYYLGNRLLAHMHNVLNGVDLHDPLSGLRVVRWELLRNWRPKSKSFDIEVELNYYVEKTGYRIREIPIRYRPRLGEKKLKLKHGFVIARRIISEA
jgi:dolichol-phosphate mannosyltransferase